MRKPTGLVCTLAALLLSLFVWVSCGIFDEEEPEELTVGITYWVGDEVNQILDIPANTAKEATINCDRLVEFGIGGINGEQNKVELVRDVNGEVTTCNMLHSNGDMLSGFQDWPALTTIYTIKVHQGSEVIEFGPFTITVNAVDEVVTGRAHLGDQGFDGSGYGCFFQTRTVGWGGGNTNPNWPSFMAERVPRLLDFATVTEGSQLMAISPDEIHQATHTFESLVNDCGYVTTTFQEYTGSLDPEQAFLTLAEVNALPDPPAGATSINLSEGLRFVYLTDEGKKGMVKVVDVLADTNGTKFDVYFTTAK